MESEQPKIIPSHLLDLGKIEKFTALFYQLCGDYRTYERAYEAVERIYSNYFGMRRYKNYESFRMARTRLQNNKQPKNE